MAKFTQYVLSDSRGRIYFPGRIFDRETALMAAKTVNDPSGYGVYLCPADRIRTAGCSDMEEIEPATYWRGD